MFYLRVVKDENTLIIYITDNFLYYQQIHSTFPDAITRNVKVTLSVLYPSFVKLRRFLEKYELVDLSFQVCQKLHPGSLKVQQ